jgi:acyl-CoA synthetase (AMP-forming)/AMP-acid ligase II
VASRTLAASIDLLADRLRDLGGRIRHVEICGSSLSREQKAKLLAIFPAARVVGFYGTSEAPRSAVLQFRTEQDKLESSGKPAPGVEISIRNGGKKPARRGQAGEVEIRGGHTMARSWDDQQRASATEKDWLRNGDVGYLDKEGYLHILGGAEDLIHVAGGVISPFEVEARIRAFYPECEICVLGIPDPLDSGNEIAVLCYTTPGNRTIILSELSRALADQIEKNKIPKIVYRIERFPHTGEMIHRKELRRRILDGVTMDEMP